MASNDYKIFQAQILNKDPVNPRQYTVVQIPDGYKLVGVQLPSAMQNQSAPQLGSVVLVIQLDAYRAYILSILREPFGYLNSDNQFRGYIPDINDPAANPISDGEIYMEATGPSSPTGEGIPGFGANLYLGNNGCAQIQSGSMGEKLIIGGTASDDDHEIVLSADFGFIESNPNEVTMVQSTYNWDNLNNIEFGNVITNTSTIVTIPVAEMTIDALGNIELYNTGFGTGLKAASLTMDSLGNLSLSSGTAGVPSSTLTMTPTGFINLNNGTNGIARLNDLAVSSSSVDPIFWLFINAIQGFFTTLSGFQGGSPVLQSQLGALGAAFLIQSPIAPPSATSSISTASLTVKAG